jgi:hypothetical protein
MGATVSFSHNVGDVIGDIEDVKDDIRHEMKKRVGAVMRVVWADAKQYVLDDPQASGDLFRSLQMDADDSREEMSFRVYNDMNIAPYAAIVEYGSGARRKEPFEESKAFPAFTDSSQKPPGWPYRAPDIDNIEGFAWHLSEWTKNKPGITGVYPVRIAIAKTTRVVRQRTESKARRTARYH